MKVLILSCSTGGGHNSCARYIEEELKANNQMEWVRCMNSIKNRAEEIALNEIIYGDVV